ncbi:MAG: hypothetical protein ACJAVY_001762 [Marinoscillum sp.]|jgi:hypothetical protein
MKNIIFITFYIGLLNGVIAQKSIIINEYDNAVNVSLDDKIILYDLINPGEEFENLAVLGEPLCKHTTIEFIAATYVFDYDGLTLTFVNHNGEIELYTISIQSNHSLTLIDQTMKIGDSAMPLLEQANNNTARKDMNLRLIENEVIDKFGKGFGYFEFVINEEDSSIKSIIYQRKTI